MSDIDDGSGVREIDRPEELPPAGIPKFARFFAYPENGNVIIRAWFVGRGNAVPKYRIRSLFQYANLTILGTNVSVLKETAVPAVRFARSHQVHESARYV